MQKTVEYHGGGRTLNQSRLRSGFWGDCPMSDYLRTLEGNFIHEDFLGWGISIVEASSVAVYGGDAGHYQTWEDTGATASLLATETHGVVELSMAAATDELHINMQFNRGAAGTIKFASGKKTWWEAAIQLDQVIEQDFYVGFSEEGLTGENAIFSDADVLSSKDHVGFRILVGDPDGLDAVYATAAAETVAKEEAQIVVADKWYRVGVYSNGTTVYWFVDGTEKANNLLSATNFPDGEELVFTISMKNAGGGATNTGKARIDWWSSAQEA